MNPFWIIDSERSFEAVCAALESAVPRHGFGVLGLHDLGATLRARGIDFPENCRIYEVCNPRQAATVLRSAMALNMALPCRISVYTESGRTRLGMIRPSLMLASLSDDAALVPVAEAVEATLRTILQDAAGA
jgi:uncharacterized protein (DUF302 family)